MDAAITLTMVTMDVEAGFGLLSFYSSVADAVTMAMAVALAASAIMAVVVVTMVTAVNGSSFFLFSSAVAEITVPAANSYRRRSLRRLLT